MDMGDLIRVIGTEIKKNKLLKVLELLDDSFSTSEKQDKLQKLLDSQTDDNGYINCVRFLSGEDSTEACNPGQEEKARDETEVELLNNFRKLDLDYKGSLLKKLTQLNALQDCDQLFEMKLTEVDKSIVRRLVDVCSVEGSNTDTLDLGEFEVLHDGVGQLIGGLGQASWEKAGFSLSAHPREEFGKANLDDSSSLCMAEVCNWLKHVYKLSQQKRSDSKEAPFSATPGAVDMSSGHKEHEDLSEFMEFVKKVELRCRAIRESTKFLKVMELQQSMAQYDEAFRKLTESPSWVLIPSEKPPEDLMQPGTKKTTFDDLLGQANAIVTKVEGVAEELRAHLKATFWSMGPLKGRRRAQEKIAKDYGGNPRRLIDIVRFSVICDDLVMVQAAIDFLKKHRDVTVLRVKCGFDPTTSVAQCGGYRDCKLNCAHNANGHIFEVQLHILSFYSLKQQGGHDVYEWSRVFSVAGIVMATDVLEDLTPELLEDMSKVVHRKIQQVSLDRGEESYPCMQWRMALVWIARMTKNKEDLQTAQLLANMAKAKSIRGASLQDLAECKLVAARSTVYELPEGIVLAKEAAAVIENTPPEKRSSSDKLFLGRCYQAIGASTLVQGKKLKKKQGLEAATQLLQDALSMFQSCVAQLTNELSAKHPVIMSVKENIAVCYSELENHDDAFKALVEVLEDLLKVSGDDHIAAGKLMIKVGGAYKERNDLRNAIAYLERGLANRIHCVGMMHPDIPKFFMLLQKCRWEAGDMQGVIDEFEQALPLLKQHDTAGKQLAEAEAKHAAAQDALRTMDRNGFLNIATINLLGNAYNALEFMSNDRTFNDHYPKLRLAFASITSDRVAEEASVLGFTIDCESLLSEEKFELNCTKDFMDRDNKLELTLRTNLVVAGMMPGPNGNPLYLSSATWREQMKAQKENYSKDPELVLWDIACNLAMEDCQSCYIQVCRNSYLNPDLIPRNIQTLLAPLPKEDVICAVQEYPSDGTAKYIALMSALNERGLKPVQPETECSVGFILSSNFVVENSCQSPFGKDPAKIYEAIGLADWDSVGAKDRASLKTTGFKTFVVDIAPAVDRPGIRLVNVHAKEFKTSTGIKIFATYLKALAKNDKGYDSIVLSDANTGDKKMWCLFDLELRAVGFDVLSPANAGYKTTRKKRSELHGQIDNKKKCLQSVEAHKAFAMLLASSSERSWRCASNARFKPDLRMESDLMLPSETWPSDHCMLQFDLRPPC